jgi:flagellar motor protein MotB
MSEKKKKHEEEEGGESVGLWYVSFADMITLLLSFFVMLTTFSSYSKEDLTKFAGVWAQLADYSVFSSVHSNEGLAPSSQRPVDFTQAGSEKPTESDPRVVQNTGESQWTAIADAYSRRRVLQVPSSRLFWGTGTQCTLLTPAGKAHLKMLSAFLRQVPCQVLIGNSIASGILPSCKGQELDRSYALLEHLRNEEHVAPGRIGLKASGPELADSSGLEGVMEITLLAEGSK